jgi:hypothetical protein
MTTLSESINALDKLSKKIDKLSSIFILTHDKKYSIVSTQQPLRKYISNLRKRNKNLNPILKNIISNDYTFILLEKFSHQTKDQLNYRMNEIKLMQENTFKPIENDLNNYLYEKSVQYEYDVLPFLNRVFIDSNIIRSNNRYSKYDFVDLNSCYFFELKTNTYSFNSYDNAVINCDKLTYPYLLLIFGYNENYYDVVSKVFKSKVIYYYIFYDENKFKHFNKRYITNKLTGRNSLVVDIPTSHLRELNDKNKIKLETKIDDKFDYILKNFISQ